MERARRIVPWALAALAVAGAGAGVLQLWWHGTLFAARLTFALDLEWMEGGMLVHALRITEGKPIYAKPSLDFIPFLYTPFYPALLAALSKVLPLGYLLGRGVSLVSLGSALAVLGAAAAGEGAEQGRLLRAAAVGIGVAGAGAVAGAFEFTGAFYDLARADALLLAIEAGTVLLALRGRGWRSAAGAGLLMGLAFLTKQTAPVVGVGIGLGLLVANWRRALVYGGVSALVMGGGLLYLTKSTGGWFWTYVFELHQSHPFRWDTLSKTPRVFRLHLWPALLALGLSTVGLGLAGRLRRSDAILWGAALAGIAAGVLGYATMWAWENAFIPMVFFPVLAAAVLTARLVVHAGASLRGGAVAVGALAALAIGWQPLHAGPPRRAARQPGPADRAAAARFLERLRALPGDGFIPFHPWYSVIAGKRPWVHRMGVLDVAAKLGRPEGLDQAILEGRFPFILLDWKTQPGEWPFMDRRYRHMHDLVDGYDTVRQFSGADTWPRHILLPVREAPAVPPGGVRLADFEGNWGAWTTTGEAFGTRPGPTTLFGAGSADSAQAGPGTMGTLRSPPLRLVHPRLRFTLAGAADPALRVLLLDGVEVVRAAQPTGGTVTVEWDVKELVGRTVVLVIEDGSRTGAIAVDEVVSF